jgi:hypothetical protein
MVVLVSLSALFPAAPVGVDALTVRDNLLGDCCAHDCVPLSDLFASTRKGPETERSIYVLRGNICPLRWMPGGRRFRDSVPLGADPRRTAPAPTVFRKALYRLFLSQGYSVPAPFPKSREKQTGKEPRACLPFVHHRSPTTYPTVLSKPESSALGQLPACVLIYANANAPYLAPNRRWLGGITVSTVRASADGRRGRLGKGASQ